MKRSEVFPSKWLAASDLDTPVTATIKDVTSETVSPDSPNKAVAHFVEPGLKPVVLNATRWSALEEITGSEDSDNWRGVRVQLSRGRTQFKSKFVDCVVVSEPPLSEVPF
jgi:hypothetical protein